MSGNEVGLGEAALQQRANTYDDDEPRIDAEDQWSQETELRGVGGGRLVHGITILTVSGAIVLAQLAWAALLVYVVVWLGRLVAP